MTTSIHYVVLCSMILSDYVPTKSYEMRRSSSGHDYLDARATPFDHSKAANKKTLPTPDTDPIIF